MNDQYNKLHKTVEDLQASVAVLQKEMKSVKRRILLSTVYGIAKVIFILIPLLWGLWYFTPQIKALYETWADLQANVASFQSSDFVSPQDGIDNSLEQYVDKLNNK